MDLPIVLRFGHHQTIDIKAIDGALNKVLKLNGKSYEFKTDEFKSRNFNKGTNFGFISQELNEILPEAVNIDSNGYQY